MLDGFLESVTHLPILARFAIARIVILTLAPLVPAHSAAGNRLIDEPALNGVLVLVLVTSVLGPILTERFGKRMEAAWQGEPVTEKVDESAPITARFRGRQEVPSCES